MTRRKMTKVQALAEFREFVLPSIRANEKDRGVKVDSVMRREAFNDYVDMLNKDGRVTDWQAFNWSNPF